jgi:hypothetical protein
MALVMHTRIPQERRFSNPATDDELIKRELPMLRIEKESNDTLQPCDSLGRIQSANIGDIQAQMDDGHVRLFMDLVKSLLWTLKSFDSLASVKNGALYWFTVHRVSASGFFASEPKGHSHTFRMASDSMGTSRD